MPSDGYTPAIRALSGWVCRACCEFRSGKPCLLSRLIAHPLPPTPLLPPHMLPVPAKSSERRAIFLLVSGHAEHLAGVRVEMSSLNRGKPQNKHRRRIVAKQISATTNFKIRSRAWLRSPKRKSFVVNIRKPMLESFELIPKQGHLSVRLQS